MANRLLSDLSPDPQDDLLSLFLNTRREEPNVGDQEVVVGPALDEAIPGMGSLMVPPLTPCPDRQLSSASTFLRTLNLYGSIDPKYPFFDSRSGNLCPALDMDILPQDKLNQTILPCNQPSSTHRLCDNHTLQAGEFMAMYLNWSELGSQLPRETALHVRAATHFLYCLRFTRAKMTADQALLFIEHFASISHTLNRSDMLWLFKLDNKLNGNYSMASLAFLFQKHLATILFNTLTGPLGFLHVKVIDTVDEWVYRPSHIVNYLYNIWYEMDILPNMTKVLTIFRLIDVSQAK